MATDVAALNSIRNAIADVIRKLPTLEEPDEVEEPLDAKVAVKALRTLRARVRFVPELEEQLRRQATLVFERTTTGSEFAIEAEKIRSKLEICRRLFLMATGLVGWSDAARHQSLILLHDLAFLRSVGTSADGDDFGVASLSSLQSVIDTARRLEIQKQIDDSLRSHLTSLRMIATKIAASPDVVETHLTAAFLECDRSDSVLVANLFDPVVANAFGRRIRLLLDRLQDEVTVRLQSTDSTAPLITAVVELLRQEVESSQSSGDRLPQHPGVDNGNPEPDRKLSMQQQALFCHKWACEKMEVDPDDTKDSVSWNHLNEHGMPGSEDGLPVITQKDLWSLATYKSHCSRARTENGEKKYDSRTDGYETRSLKRAEKL